MPTVELTPHAGEAVSWGEELDFVNPPAAELLIDARQLVSADLLFVLRLRAYIERCALNGAEVRLMAPETSAVAQELNTLGIARGLPDGCSVEFPDEIGTALDEGVLIPITHLTSSVDSDALDDRLGELALDPGHMPPPIGRLGDAFQSAVGEICDNATTHGGSECGAFVVARRYGTTNCVIAVGDLGIGIPEHLRSGLGGDWSDPEALKRATEEGVSGTGSSHRGYGYHWVPKAIRDAKTPRGAIQIWSGTARYDGRYRHGEVQYAAVEDAPDTPGAWVRIQLRLD